MSQLPQEAIDEFVGACHGDLATVQKALGKHPDLLNASARWAETPIQAASHAADRGVAEFLLSKGAPLDVTTAAMLGMVDRVRALLQQTPSLARTVGAHGLSVLYHAATTGQIEIAALLVTSGSEVNQGEGGNTALHAAARFRQLEMVGWLLDHGANVNASDYERKTPLRVAVESGHADVTELLRRRGGHE